jgi:hypothetical protein
LSSVLLECEINDSEAISEFGLPKLPLRFYTLSSFLLDRIQHLTVYLTKGKAT